jgi:DNA invertase Pin-like site-specific DNA recombinase
MFDQLVAATEGSMGAAGVGAWARVENAACARRLAVMADMLEAAWAEDGSAEREQWCLDNWDAVAAQIGAAQNVSAGAASHQLLVAQALRERLPRVAEVFATGAITYRMVNAVVARTKLIQDREAMAKVDAELAAHVTGWGSLSVAKTQTAIDYWVDRYDPGALRRTETRSRDRHFDVVPAEDGSGLASVEGTLFAHDGAVLDQRVTALTGTVCEDDPRTVDQRRADAMAALGAGADRLACQCGAQDCPAAEHGAPRTDVVIHVIAEHDSLTDDTPVQLDGNEAPGPPADPDHLTDETAVPREGAQPGPVDDKPVREMTIGEALAPRQEPSAGPARTTPAAVIGGPIIPAPLLAAKLAATATIRPLIHPGDAPPEPRYTPSRNLADFVRCRDMTCRFPGCDEPAVGCDLDHTIAYPVGPTCASNMKCLCRKHCGCVKYTLSMRAAVYLRQSLDRTGEALAVARQRGDCLTLCKQRGWTPVEFVDNDVSASTGKRRPGYERMLAGIADGKIGAVVAWDLDRLHRRPVELEAFMALADEKHLALATVSGDVDLSTAQGRLVARLKGAVARHEVEHKVARQKRAARQKAERGEPQWRNAFGYLPDGSRIPDPDTAPLVRRAYAAVLAGSSLADVCRLFNDAEAFTLKGNQWTESLVSQFLRKPRNAGLRAHNGEIVGAGTWPALMDENTWRAAQNVLDAPGRAPGRKTVRRHLLTGVLGCGKQGCGHYLSGMWSAKKAIVYACKQCRGVSIAAEHVEPLVYRVVSGRLAMPDAVDLLRSEIHDEAEAEALRVETSTLLAELDNIGVERGEGLLTGKQAKIATDVITEKLQAIERRQQDQEKLRVFDGIPLGQPEAVDAVQQLSPDRFRAVLNVLADITVAPVGKGGHTFNPERVQVEWR